MALDVSFIQGNSPIKAEGARHAQAAAVEQRPGLAPAAEIPSDLKAKIKDLQRVSEAFDRRLSFSFNEKLGQVVVKVIENDTDKIVREIPPTELQQVYERIREVIGLLFDKSA
jgi:flagellar protein FlaG